MSVLFRSRPQRKGSTRREIIPLCSKVRDTRCEEAISRSESSRCTSILRWWDYFMSLPDLRNMGVGQIFNTSIGLDRPITNRNTPVPRIRDFGTTLLRLRNTLPCLAAWSQRMLSSLRFETNSLPLTAFYPSLALKWSHTKFEALAPRTVMSAALFIGGQMFSACVKGFDIYCALLSCPLNYYPLHHPNLHKLTN
jgi:hypothetical protein